jgi:hypothetical protein
MPIEKEGLQDSRSIKKPDRRIAVSFLGSALRENPQLLDNINPRDSYVLFAHSDIKRAKSYKELGPIFGTTSQTLSKVFHREMARVWDQASDEIKAKYPLTVIFQAVNQPTEEQRVRMSKAQKKRYQDPEQIKINRDTQRAIAQTPKQKAIYERFSQEHKGKRPSKKTRTKMSHSQRDKYKNNPQLIETLRQYMIKRYEDPEERRKSAGRQRLLMLGKWRKQQIAGMTELQQRRVRKIDLYDYELWQMYQQEHNDAVILATGEINAEELADLRKYFTGETTPANVQTLLDKFSIAIAKAA